MHSKYICLLGFSKQAEKIIKSQLEKYATGANIVWVSANDKKLSGVIINAMFLDTPQIKKYVSTVAAPCVSIYTQDAGKHIAASYAIPAIELKEPMQFDGKWLDTLLQQQSFNDDATVTNQETTAQNVIINAPGENYRQLISLIKDRKPIYITATCDIKRVCLFPAERNAYINFAREEIPGIEYWQWSIVENVPHIEGMRRINIDQWLFETIWQSQTGDFPIDKSMFYKLIRWPQPFSQYKRSEALRLAAQIKFHPVTISDLVEKTHFPPNLIEQFIFATNQAGQVEIVNPSSAKNTIVEKNLSTATRKDPDREVKRSFIGKLRAKLGL